MYRIKYYLINMNLYYNEVIKIFSLFLMNYMNHFDKIISLNHKFNNVIHIIVNSIAIIYSLI